jgi:hypothetical protein
MSGYVCDFPSAPRFRTNSSKVSSVEKLNAFLDWFRHLFIPGWTTMCAGFIYPIVVIIIFVYFSFVFFVVVLLKVETRSIASRSCPEQPCEMVETYATEAEGPRAP